MALPLTLGPASTYRAVPRLSGGLDAGVDGDLDVELLGQAVFAAVLSAPGRFADGDATSLDL